MNFDIKGLDSLMAGLSRFKSSHSVEKWRLLVVGKGEQRKYKKLAADLDIGENILFAGIVPRERLKSYYSASDFFAMPSKFDTFGMTVLEAMAASPSGRDQRKCRGKGHRARRDQWFHNPGYEQPR